MFRSTLQQTQKQPCNSISVDMRVEWSSAFDFLASDFFIHVKKKSPQKKLPDPYFSRIRENEQHRVVMSLDLESHKCKRVQLISLRTI